MQPKSKISLLEDIHISFGTDGEGGVVKGRRWRYCWTRRPSTASREAKWGTGASYEQSRIPRHQTQRPPAAGLWPFWRSGTPRRRREARSTCTGDASPDPPSASVSLYVPPLTAPSASTIICCCCCFLPRPKISIAMIPVFVLTSLVCALRSLQALACAGGEGGPSELKSHGAYV